eukprot:CAMPEP_0180662830 /NCGR_PEP_ID=MMETSP1037_2-20121125/59598_1 /TAXON_ID=632150 /ORGANISM="Azadinium spinosum, Strain 3D9" /LENGTH=58 /DNA_ID=CAMNT_0022690513 /DNA_START=185 /DNA_END=361 /DNA_ORIENTATION=+
MDTAAPLAACSSFRRWRKRPKELLAAAGDAVGASAFGASAFATAGAFSTMGPAATVPN